MTVRDEVGALTARFSKAVANRDLDDLLALFDSEARLLPPNAPMAEGTAAIRQVYRGVMDTGAPSLDLKIVDVHESGDLVIAVGRYVHTIRPPGGESTEDRGKYVDVFRRQPDGSLKFIADIFNSDLPRPPTEQYGA
jgi:ketosteroid isomerase-like protein